MSPASVRRVAAPRPALVALALALAVLLGTGSALGQIPILLVKNMVRSQGAGTAGITSNDNAQAFTTGTHTFGYKLTQVQIRFASVSTTLPTYTAAIYSVNSSGEPDTLVGTLTKPTALSVGTNNRYTTTGIDLDASTTYVVFLDTTATASSTVEISTTTEDDEDLGGAPGWSIANTSLQRNHDATAWSTVNAAWRFAIRGHLKGPSFQSATVNGTALTVTFNGNLDTGSQPEGSAFTVSGGRTGTGTVSITGATVSVILDSAVAPNETVTVSYAKPGTNPLQDTASTPYEVASFSGEAVTNTTPGQPDPAPDPVPDPAPASVQSAYVGGRTLMVTFDKALRESPVPAPAAFDVRAAGERHDVRYALIDGAVLTLRLHQPVDVDRTVTLTYRQPTTRPLTDVDGNRVRSFFNQAVQPTTPTPAMPFAAVVLLALLLARRGRRGLAP